MKKRIGIRTAKKLLAGCIAASMMFGKGFPLRNGGTGTQNDGIYRVYAAEQSSVQVGIDGEFTTPDMDAMIKRINEIRLEACEKGYRNPETGLPLTKEDYNPIGWNSDMEGIAKVRAAEALVCMAHTRPNGESTFTVDYNGKHANAEILAWNQNMAAGLEAWYSEISMYLDGDYDSELTGHYRSLISPSFNSIGMAGYESKEIDNVYSLKSYSGELSYEEPDNRLLDSYGKSKVQIDVSAEKIDSVQLAMEAPLVAVGDTLEGQLITKAVFRTIINQEEWGVTTEAVTVDSVIWSSEDTKVAVVTQDGRIQGVGKGTTTITATLCVGGKEFKDSRKIIVTDGGVYIASVEDPEPIDGQEGYIPKLPSTVNAVMSDGEMLEIPVEWEEEQLTRQQFASLTGKTVEVKGSAEGFSVTQKVVVPAAKILSVATTPDGVNAELETESGTKIDFPNIYVKTASNGIWSLPGTWDPEAQTYYREREGGTFLVHGTTAYGQTAEFTLTVHPAVVVGAAPTEEEGIVETGTVPTYPEYANITWSNGDVTREKITWNTEDQAEVDYNAKEESWYMVSGCAAGQTFFYTVHVMPVYPTKVYLVSSTGSVVAGTAPALPEEANVIWSDNHTTKEKIEWDQELIDLIDYNSREGGLYTVWGKVRGKDISYTVKVEPAKPDKIELPENMITVEAGNSFGLPLSAKVTWSNGEQTQENITWSEKDIDRLANQVNGPGIYKISGTCQGQTVIYTVKVTAPIVVSYRTHVQNIGWQSFVSDGVMAGTSGMSKRLEGIEIKVSGNSSLGIQYTTHCQTYGWLPWSCNGEMNGTEGESKRLEAIKIRLIGEDADQYDIYYRVHAQTYGWLGWAKNGEAAGTAGMSKRLEGIQIVIQKKGTEAPGDVESIHSVYVSAYKVGNGLSTSVNVSGADKVNVAVTTHVQTFGWQGWKFNGALSGTSGQSKRLEGIKIKLTNNYVGGGITYQTNIESYGWTGWKSDGAFSGTSGQSKRLEAIQIKLTGEMAQKYDVYYRVHSQKFGWLGWAKNGETAGTIGYDYRLESIQIVLVEKGKAALGNTVAGITGPAGAAASQER